MRGLSQNGGGILARTTWNKYHAKKVVKDGHTFDSKKEAGRYTELKILEKAGIISRLKCQVPFELIPAQYENGKCIERSCKYFADFTYWQDGQYIVEDAKGVKTDAYRIKKKAMLYKYGVKIREV